jgi:FKBP-type peptidyl-prolyl cis-trans isomerase FkpA
MKRSKVSLSLLVALFGATAVSAQSNGFETLPGGIQYKVVKHGTATAKPAVGDYVELHVHFHVGDSVLFDSRKMNKNEPVPLQVQEPRFHGDPMEGFMKMSVGDSVVMNVPIDSMKKAGGRMAPWMKDGQMFEYDIVMVSLKTPAEKKKETEEAAAKQTVTDEKLLKEYFEKNHIKATKTASGLYYKVEKEGTGDVAKAGQTVTVNYTGKTLDGVTFDSNVDSNFHHQKPFDFTLGRGQVIKGWDEGVALMKKGEKATLYIPSPLAYGERSPSPKIPENAILIFDVEVADIK